jgi:proteasome alpha subunit
MPEVRVVIPTDLDRALDALIKAGFAGNKAELARTAITHFLSTIPTQLPKGYDLETAFSPDGRIFQLEYAEETIRRGGTIVGICCSEGVVLAKEVPRIRLFEIVPNPFNRIFKVHQSIGMTYCGLQADGYILIEEAIKQIGLLEKEGSADIEELVKKLVLFLQPFIQRKNVRPLGVATIIGGLDSQNKPRLFLLNSNGVVREHKACAHGRGETESIDILKEGYKANLTLREAVALAVKTALREAKKPENVLVATIDTKTKTFKDIAIKETL